MGKHSAKDGPAPAPIRIRVANSAGDWPNSGAVAEGLLREWMEAGQPREVTVVVSGVPSGAEQMARTIAQQKGWHVSLEKPTSSVDVTLSFAVQDTGKPDGSRKVTVARFYTLIRGYMPDVANQQDDHLWSDATWQN